MGELISIVCQELRSLVHRYLAGQRPGHTLHFLAVTASLMRRILVDYARAPAAIDPPRSGVVDLKFFDGLETREIAEVLGVSELTVLREWKLAKVWLLRELSRE